MELESEKIDIKDGKAIFVSAFDATPQFILTISEEFYDISENFLPLYSRIRFNFPKSSSTNRNYTDFKDNKRAFNASASPLLPLHS